MSLQTQQHVSIAASEISLRQLHETVGGRIQFGDMPPLDREASPIPRIVTDSREVQQGDLFWALQGKQNDGNDYVNEAFVRGAAGVVASRPIVPWAGQWALVVPDTTLALWEYAHAHRTQYTGKVVAITGSVGKTSTKKMIDAVLNTRFCGTVSPYNYNNQFGLPLSLLQLSMLDDYGVFEIGASGPGEIDSLAQLCQPSVGVITCIGDAHLGGFGTQQAVTSAKLELLSHLADDGVALLSGDDPLLRRYAAKRCKNIQWFGRTADCDFMATEIDCRDGQLNFKIDRTTFKLPTYNRHDLSNALAAFAVGKLFGLNHADIASGLEHYHAPPMRCQIKQLGSITVIDDSYNSSPQAMQAALSLLRDYDHTGRKIVVCGEMAELGEQADEYHEKLGQQVVTLCGADYLITCGQYAEQVQAAAIAAGMNPRCCHNLQNCDESYDEILVELEKLVLPQDAILVKGCRTMKMEQLVEKFTKGQFTQKSFRRAA